MNMNRSLYFQTLICLAFFCFSSADIKAQGHYKVLFLGNSYTDVNDLPQLVHDVAQSAGDTLIFDRHTPGGYRLIDHSLNTTSRSKIMTGGWDYVVIQGQSQEPITQYGNFTQGAGALYSLTKEYNSCAVIMPYITWGRKNGDATNCANFPIMCTYEGMDSTLRNTYIDLSKAISAEASPVSVVWNYLRNNHPQLELYQTDESHPSALGSYAVACCFYTSLFKKDPTLITYNFGLSESEASIIKNAVKQTVFFQLDKWDFKKAPVSKMIYQIGTGVNEIHFNAINYGVTQNYLWDFGDGTTSTISNPTHTFTNNGTYKVTLSTSNCDVQGLHTSVSDTVLQFCNHTPTVYSTRSWLCESDTLWTQAADAYQWFSYGIKIPETNQYITNYTRYAHSGFSVLSTVGGCSEFSTAFDKFPEWSGYYFDLIGDPCKGDTVVFAVLHANGSLSGFENIFWYKNDTLLSSHQNEDTLLVTSGGKYECKVVNPSSNCPLDTTVYSILYDCGVTGIEKNNVTSLISVYPNPSSKYIHIQLRDFQTTTHLEIYNDIGILQKSIPLNKSFNTIAIDELRDGVYFMRLKGNAKATRFIKLTK